MGAETLLYPPQKWTPSIWVTVPLYYRGLAVPRVRSRRIDGGRARVTEYPGGEACGQEQDHEGDCRDREVMVCAAPSFRRSRSRLSFHRAFIVPYPIGR